MSMNFAREQSLLRQRLQAAGSPQLAEASRLALGSKATFLGASAEAIASASADLIAAYPQMGRAQMTAFVRTLWQSRIHELRTVGIELLAARATLLEPADLPFLEGLLKDCDADPLAARIADSVVGAVVVKNRKLWKDLKRFANASQELLRVAAVRASRLPLLDDPEAFQRFADLATPLVASTDARLQQAIDELLAAAAAVHQDAVVAFASQHGRKVTLPRKKAAKAAPKPTPENPAAPMPATVMPATVIASKPPAKVSATKVGKTPAKAAAKASTKGGAKNAAKTPAKPAAKKRATTKKD